MEEIKNKIPNPPEAPPTTDDPEIYGKYILEQLKIIKKDLKNNCVYNEKNINTINKLSLSFTRKKFKLKKINVLQSKIKVLNNDIKATMKTCNYKMQRGGSLIKM